MNHFRLILSALLTVSFTLISIFALHRKSSELPTQEQVENINVDQLRDISYRKGNRKENFEAFGLTDEEVDRALSRAKEVETKEKKIIENLSSPPGDIELLVDSLCGHSSDIRPRYATLRYAVRIRGDKREPMDMRKIKFASQDWVDGLALKDMYATVELRKDPYIDSTVMMIAAILAGEEELLVERQPPFGRGSDWSWKKAKREFTGIEDAVIEYLAHMHVIIEVAQGIDGICD